MIMIMIIIIINEDYWGDVKSEDFKGTYDTIRKCVNVALIALPTPQDSL